MATPPELLVFICHSTAQDGLECLASKMLWHCLVAQSLHVSPYASHPLLCIKQYKSCFIFLCGGFCHALKEPESDYTEEWWNMSSCSCVPPRQKGRRQSDLFLENSALSIHHNCGDAFLRMQQYQTLSESKMIFMYYSEIIFKKKVFSCHQWILHW